jgi:hypothetical protein
VRVAARIERIGSKGKNEVDALRVRNAGRGCATGDMKGGALARWHHWSARQIINKVLVKGKQSFVVMYCFVRTRSKDMVSFKLEIM